MEQPTEHAVLPPQPPSVPPAPQPPSVPPAPQLPPLFGADAISQVQTTLWMPQLPPRQPRPVPPGWDGRPYGPMRTAVFSFPCVGACRRVCAAGTLAQPHRDVSVAGPGAWQRMCRACYLPLRARALWAKARRAHSSYVARVLARGLLRAYARATERAYAPGGIGYAHVRDDFVERAHKQQRM